LELEGLEDLLAMALAVMDQPQLLTRFHALAAEVVLEALVTAFLVDQVAELAMEQLQRELALQDKGLLALDLPLAGEVLTMVLAVALVEQGLVLLVVQELLAILLALMS
jgi:hypothetical protein